MDAADASMGTFGEIDVEIFTANFSSCIINELDGDGNDFEAGDIDVFEVSTVLLILIRVQGGTEKFLLKLFLASGPAALLLWQQ